MNRQKDGWFRAVALFVPVAFTILSVLTPTATQAQDIERVLRATRIEGGLAVHVGCGQGRQTAALHSTGQWLVHGLDRDESDVRKARKYLRSRGLYGEIAVRHWDGGKLPYTDHLVNLLVIEDAGSVPESEIERVLAPTGEAWIERNGRLRMWQKPWPDELDEWTHYLYDATNNAVSKDKKVGPPRHMQWRAEPLWCRYHHKLSSISAVVSAQGRIFYVADLAPPASIQLPSDWHVMARDAFNGKLLWDKELPSWAYHLHGFRSGPPQLPRLVVAKGDRLFLPLGLNKPISEVDAATGEVLATYEPTSNAEEIILAEGMLLTVKGLPVAEQAWKHGKFKQEYKFPNRKKILAVDTDTGALQWQWSHTQNPMPETLASDGERVFCQVGQGVVCLDMESGKKLWSFGNTGKAGRRRKFGFGTHTLVVSDDVVLCKLSGKLIALAADDGEKLWDAEGGKGFHSPVDIFVIDGKVWQGHHPQGSVQPPPVRDFSMPRKLHTGEVVSENRLMVAIQTAGHHHRCYREKATSRHIITGKRGIELMDLQNSNHSRNNWIRGACQYGIMPANGLMYAPSHCCGCYMEAKLFGFWATDSSRQRPVSSADLRAERLTEGPAYGKSGSAPGGSKAGEDWPTYRHDALRSGSTDSELSEDLSEGWTANVGGRVTAPVVADGRVIVASEDEQQVVAFDATDGDRLWSFTPDGPVDSPPTLWRERVIFGCGDGNIYSLRASDGELVWCFRAAPQERLTVDCEQLESVWPVHGSVLVLDGVVYASAGRSTYLDGGIWMYALDPETGELLQKKQVESEQAKVEEGPESPDKNLRDDWERISQNVVDTRSKRAPDLSDSFSMQGGTINDVLVSDGYSIYLKQMRFGKDLQRKEKMGRHLFSTSTLLNPVEVHRSHWVVGTGDFSRIPVAYSWIANRRAGRGKTRLGRPYGVILSFDEDTAWCVWRRYNKPGYRLFAVDNAPFSPGPAERQADFKEFDKHEEPQMKWSTQMLLRPRAMVRAGGNLLLGGNIDRTEAKDELAAYRGEEGGLLWIYSADGGEKRAEYDLKAPPVWNGMAAADGRLYVTDTDGRLLCFSGRGK